MLHPVYEAAGKHEPLRDDYKLKNRRRSIFSVDGEKNGETADRHGSYKNQGARHVTCNAKSDRILLSSKPPVETEIKENHRGHITTEIDSIEQREGCQDTRYGNR